MNNFQTTGRPRTSRVLSFLVALVLLLPFANAGGAPLQAEKAETGNRKVKVSMPPDYPELARKKNLHGVVRVLLTVAPDGKVVNVKELGGNPVLLTALAEATKKWRYEPADRQSSVEVSFEFK
jgi:TonB family protein